MWQRELALALAFVVVVGLLFSGRVSAGLQGQGSRAGSAGAISHL